MDSTEPKTDVSSIAFLLSFMHVSPPCPQSIEMSVTSSPNLSPSSSISSISTILSNPQSPKLPPIQNNEIENFCSQFSDTTYIQCKFKFHQPKSKNFTPPKPNSVIPIITEITNNKQRHIDDYIDKIDWQTFKIFSQPTAKLSNSDTRYALLLKNLQTDIYYMSKYNNVETFNKLITIYHDTVQTIEPLNCDRKIFHYNPSNQKIKLYNFKSQQSFIQINKSMEIKQEAVLSNENSGQLEENFYQESNIFGSKFIERDIQVHQTDEYKKFFKSGLGREVMATNICSYIDSFCKPTDEACYHVYDDHKRTRRGKKKPKPQKKLHSIKDYGLCRVKGSRIMGQKREYTRVKLFKQKYKK